jgi:transposase
MLNFGVRRIFLSRSVTGMSKGIDALAALVRTQFGMDPMTGDAFLFLGADFARLKILVWDGSGFWLCYKRLDRGGTFAVPRSVGKTGTPGAVVMSQAELALLLEGIEVMQFRRCQERSASTQ